jgi:hypothetical protein
MNKYINIIGEKLGTEAEPDSESFNKVKEYIYAKRNMTEENKEKAVAIIYNYFHYGMPLRYLCSILNMDYRIIFALVRKFKDKPDLNTLEERQISYLLRNKDEKFKEKFNEVINKLKNIEGLGVNSYVNICLHAILDKRLNHKNINENLFGISYASYRKNKDIILKMV